MAILHEICKRRRTTLIIASQYGVSPTSISEADQHRIEYRKGILSNFHVTIAMLSNDFSKFFQSILRKAWNEYCRLPATSPLQVSLIELDEAKRLDAEQKRLESRVAKKQAAEEKRLKVEEMKATVKRMRLAEEPMRDAANAKRAKVKRDGFASARQDALLELKTNKQYEVDFMATNKSRITKAVSDIKKWSADEKNRRFSTDQLPGIQSSGKKWRIQLRFSGQSFRFGTFETLQTANYVCQIARGIVGPGSADMKDNILTVELAKMAIDAGLKALSLIISFHCVCTSLTKFIIPDYSRFSNIFLQILHSQRSCILLRQKYNINMKSLFIIKIVYIVSCLPAAPNACPDRLIVDAPSIALSLILFLRAFPP